MNTDTQKSKEPKRTAIETKATEYVNFVLPLATTDHKDTARRAFCAGCLYMNKTVHAAFSKPHGEVLRELESINDDVHDYFQQQAEAFAKRRANQ